MGVGAVVAMGTIRMSLSRFTTDQEVAQVGGLLPGLVKDLRDTGPMARR